MKTRNQALLADLNEYLDGIRSRINTHKHKIYETELNNLSNSIQHSLKVSHKSCFFEKIDAVKCIMKIINKIDKDIASLEVEMHGVANYSNYESKRVGDIAFKQSIKDDLNKMLKLIVDARPEIRNSELSGIIKLLR
jgi:hypothetical protein